MAAQVIEIAPGLELRISVSCGVADYRFGSAMAGVLADADRAMYSAKDLARGDGQSHIAYRNEISEAVPVREQAAAD